MDSLNFDFMGNNVKAVVANLCVLAGIQHSDVAYVDVSPTPLNIGDIVLEAAQLHIYPNPTNDHVLISVSGADSDADYHLEIIDEAGRLVVRRSVKLSAGELTLDVSKWDAGVYNVTVRSPGFSLSQNMIVQ
ncbi:MAG TPA: T9SS type A sorting domain-containing protein [Flavobacteriales bacterium]|nr:T9SS type A sorting domain-containing protein [Flavobacteriales bacterium]